jgi:hypothetical protein
MVVDAEVVVAVAVVVATSTVCLGGGITGICQTVPLIMVSAWPPGACILPVW